MRKMLTVTGGLAFAGLLSFVFPNFGDDDEKKSVNNPASSAISNSADAPHTPPLAASAAFGSASSPMPSASQSVTGEIVVKGLDNCDVSGESNCQHSTSVPKNTQDKINNLLTEASDSLRRAKEHVVGSPDHLRHVQRAMEHFLGARHTNVMYAFNNNSGIYATTVSLDIELKDPNQLAKLYADSLTGYLQQSRTNFANVSNVLEKQSIATQVRDEILEFNDLMVGYLGSNKSIIPNGSTIPYTLPIVLTLPYIKNPTDSMATVDQDGLASKFFGFKTFDQIVKCAAMNLKKACLEPN